MDCFESSDGFHRPRTTQTLPPSLHSPSPYDERRSAGRRARYSLARESFYEILVEEDSTSQGSTSDQSSSDDDAGSSLADDVEPLTSVPLVPLNISSASQQDRARESESPHADASSSTNREPIPFREQLKPIVQSPKSCSNSQDNALRISTESPSKSASLLNCCLWGMRRKKIIAALGLTATICALAFTIRTYYPSQESESISAKAYKLGLWTECQDRKVRLSTSATSVAILTENAGYSRLDVMQGNA